MRDIQILIQTMNNDEVTNLFFQNSIIDNSSIENQRFFKSFEITKHYDY